MRRAWPKRAAAEQAELARQRVDRLEGAGVDDLGVVELARAARRR